MKRMAMWVGVFSLLVLAGGCISQPERLGVKPGEVFRAIGRGAPAEDAVNEAQANLLAQRAAKLDAVRNLLESVKGVLITSTTRVEDFIVTEDKIVSAVAAFLQGIVVEREEKMSDGSWEVEVYLTYEQLKVIMDKI